MKSKLILISILSSAVGYGAKIQVNNIVNGIGDTIFADSSGTLLSGTIASGGYFNSDSASFNFATSVASEDFATLVANFNPLTSGIVGGPNGSLSGPFAGFVEGPIDPLGTITGGNALIGENLYTFVGDAATLADSTSFALVDNLREIEDDNPFEFTYTLNPAAGTPLIGTTGTLSGNLSGEGEGENPTIFLSDAVPEPSTLLLSALGVLALLRRKR